MTQKSTYEELEQKVKELEKEKLERKQTEQSLDEINMCLLGLGSDFTENVNRLTSLAGKLFGATCALYNRLDGGMLYSVGQWQTPSDYDPVDKPDGHICYDVIQRGVDDLLIVQNLQNSIYAKTDPNVVRYGLETYVGHSVKCSGQYVGSLCTVFQKEFNPTEEEKRIIGILASAIRVEEERKQAEEALRESEEKYRRIFENIQDVYYEVTLDGVIIEISPSIKEISKYSREELIGTSAYNLYAYPEKRDDFVKELLKRGKVTDCEIILKDKDGLLGYCSTTAKLLNDAHGVPVKIIGSMRNITERKQAEEALQKAHDELEYRVKKRTKELEIKTKRLEEVNTALNVMLQKREEDKIELEKKVIFNIKELIEPLINNLKNSGLDPNQTSYLDVLESFLNEIISPFSRTLYAKYRHLTPSEIRVANLVKEGKSTKEIAVFLNSSQRAVEFHRNNLRKKLGFKNRKTNLRSYLLSLL